MGKKLKGIIISILVLFAFGVWSAFFLLWKTGKETNLTLDMINGGQEFADEVINSNDMQNHIENQKKKYMGENPFNPDQDRVPDKYIQISQSFLEGTWEVTERRQSAQTVENKTGYFRFQGNEYEMVGGQIGGTGTYELVQDGEYQYLELSTEYAAVVVRLEKFDDNWLRFNMPGEMADLNVRRVEMDLDENDPFKVIPGDEIVPDDNLNTAILLALGEEPNRKVTKEDIYLLKDLSNIDGVIDFTGLQWAINLETIDLSNASITDLSPLSELEKLSFIRLSGNAIDQRVMDELIKVGKGYELIFDFTDSNFSNIEIVEQFLVLEHFPLLLAINFANTNVQEGMLKKLKRWQPHIQFFGDNEVFQQYVSSLVPPVYANRVLNLYFDY